MDLAAPLKEPEDGHLVGCGAPKLAIACAAEIVLVDLDPARHDVRRPGLAV